MQALSRVAPQAQRLYRHRTAGGGAPAGGAAGAVRVSARGWWGDRCYVRYHHPLDPAEGGPCFIVEIDGQEVYRVDLTLWCEEESIDLPGYHAGADKAYLVAKGLGPKATARERAQATWMIRQYRQRARGTDGLRAPPGTATATGT